MISWDILWQLPPKVTFWWCLGWGKNLAQITKSSLGPFGTWPEDCAQIGRSFTDQLGALEMLPPNFGAISNWQLGMAAWLYASLRSWFDMPGRVPRRSCGNQEALDVWLCHKILQPRHEQAHCQSLGQTFCNSDVASQYVPNYFIMFWRLRQTWKHGHTWRTQCRVPVQRCRSGSCLLVPFLGPPWMGTLCHFMARDNRLPWMKRYIYWYHQPAKRHYKTMFCIFLHRTQGLFPWFAAKDVDANPHLHVLRVVLPFCEVTSDTNTIVTASGTAFVVLVIAPTSHGGTWAKHGIRNAPLRLSKIVQDYLST